MKRACSFLIVCLILAACHAPRQVVITEEKIVTIHDTIPVVTFLPPTSVTLDTFINWSGEDFFDIITVEDSTSKAVVVATGNRAEGKRSYHVTSSRKADTVFQNIPIVVTDTFFITKACPPCEEVPQDGKFPWWWLIGFLGALTVWWVGNRKNKSESVR